MDAAKAALQGEFAATAFQSLRLISGSRDMGKCQELLGLNTVDGSESHGQPPVRCKKLCNLMG